MNNSESSSNDDLDPVQIVDTGVANIASLLAAFQRLNQRGELIDTANQVRDAKRLVLPGVGSFGAAMERLQELKLVTALRERIHADQPTLAICLGMQLLCSSSQETPGVEGIGVLPHEVQRFSRQVKVPQLGWNEVTFDEPSLIPAGHAYFANSYRLRERPAGWRAATTDYDGQFVSAIQRGKILACQFHPELSGRWGERLLQHWLGT